MHNVRALIARRPRLGPVLLGLAAFVAASLCATLIAWGAAVVIEGRSARAVSDRFATAGFGWASAEADGLQIRLTGTAPNEAARFRAVNMAGSVVEASRVVDDFEVTPARAFEAPRYSLEMLRNDDGIQLIGLLPSTEDETRLLEIAAALQPEQPPSEMIETASYAAPDSWAAAFDYGIAALKMLPRSKISVDANRVGITAIAASDQEKRQFEAQLNRSRPQGVKVEIAISAPRPVLTPFTLRFVKDAEGARFDACSADTDRARDRILAAGRRAGVEGAVACTIGLGVPTPSWAIAAEAGIAAVSELGNSTITFSDADVTLLATADVAQADFDRVVGELQTALPAVFSLDATLEKRAQTAPAGPAEFTASLKHETGRVELRGRVTDPMERKAVDSFARARFGANQVYIATRFDPELPPGWAVRVLAGLSALNELDEGTVVVRADVVEVKGVTGSQAARGRISQILSDQLGQGQTFRVDVRYDEALDPTAALPTPEECHDQVAALLSRQKISFTPGSAEIDAKAGPVMTGLATILEKCEGVEMEIGGYTDSQGSEQGNRALSQARAEAVILALQGRRVDISSLRAVGYGEEDPIADNGTEEGREANRRIEFRLVGAAAPDDALPALTGADGTALPGAVAGSAATVALGSLPGSAPPEVFCRDRIATLLSQQKIAFAPGSADPTPGTASILDAIATTLASCPGTTFDIGGHTDSQGSEGGNRKLSQERANAVLVALAKRQVDVASIKATGYGEDNPIADNGTEEGRETNRRIEFKLIGKSLAAAETYDATPASAGQSDAGQSGAATLPPAGGDGSEGQPGDGSGDGPSNVPEEADGAALDDVPMDEGSYDGEAMDDVSAEDGPMEDGPTDEAPMEDMGEGEAPAAVTGADSATADSASPEAAPATAGTATEDAGAAAAPAAPATGSEAADTDSANEAATATAPQAGSEPAEAGAAEATAPASSPATEGTAATDGTAVPPASVPPAGAPVVTTPTAAAPEAAPAATPPSETAPAAAPAAATDSATGTATETGPDFSGDDSPSLAPQEKTQRPPPRPARNG